MLVDPTAYQEEKPECDESIMARVAFMDRQAMIKLHALREAHNEEVDKTDQKIHQWLDRLDRHVEGMGG